MNLERGMEPSGQQGVLLSDLDNVMPSLTRSHHRRQYTNYDPISFLSHPAHPQSASKTR
jgi:hypothetical protein